ncbi:DNA/RNA non-specific endonuclease [Gordonia sp. NPDC003376]
MDEHDHVVDELEPGGTHFVDYPDLLSWAVYPASGTTIPRALEGEWAALYERATPGRRDVRAFTTGTFTYLWDVTSPEDSAFDARMVGVYGTSAKPRHRRSSSRMAGFPLRRPPGGFDVHRGHIAAHSVGGPDEGFNLVVQSARVNLSARWRRMEKYAATRPGTFLFVRCIYRDTSSTPAAFEYGLILDDDSIIVERFLNR